MPSRLLWRLRLLAEFHSCISALPAKEKSLWIIFYTDSKGKLPILFSCTSLQMSVTMQLILQTVFCCCLLATVAPSVHSAKYDLRRVLRKSVWPQRSKRDLSLAALRTLENSPFVRPDEVKDSLMPHSSTDISVRTKRSKNSINQSRRAGCSLGTCTVHVLAHRLHDLNNKLKIGNAPPDKISPLGYGRRRRSVPEEVLSLRREGRRLRPVRSSSVSPSRLRKLEALLKRT